MTKPTSGRAVSVPWYTLAPVIGIHELEGLGGDGQFAEAAQVIADHRLRGHAGFVALLVDVDGGAVTQGVRRGGKLQAGRPERSVRVGDRDRLAVRDGRGELQVEPVVDAQITNGQAARRAADA